MRARLPKNIQPSLFEKSLDVHAPAKPEQLNEISGLPKDGTTEKAN
jgi:hypothetical protein